MANEAATAQIPNSPALITLQEWNPRQHRGECGRCDRPILRDDVGWQRAGCAMRLSVAARELKRCRFVRALWCAPRGFADRLPRHSKSRLPQRAHPTTGAYSACDGAVRRPREGRRLEAP